MTVHQKYVLPLFLKEPEMDNPQNVKPEFVAAQSSTSDGDKMDLFAPVHQLEDPSQVTCSNSLLVCSG